MQESILIQISPDTLRSMISEAVGQAVDKVRAITQPKYLTRKEVAEMYSVTLPTVHSWVNSGKLHAVKIGGRTLFSAEEVNRATENIPLLKKKRLK